MEFRVRPIEEDDLEMIMNWRMLKDVTRYMNTDPKLTLESQRKWFQSAKESQTAKYWVVEVGGIPAGVINLANIDYKARRASWGYYIAKKQLRSMKLALSLELSLYHYAFSVLCLNEIYGQVFSENWEVVRIHEICGCCIEKKENDIVEKDGVRHEITRISLTREAWQRQDFSKKYNFIDFGGIGGVKNRMFFACWIQQVQKCA